MADRNQSKTVGTSTITFDVFFVFRENASYEGDDVALSLNSLIYTSRMRLVVLSIVNSEHSTLKYPFCSLSRISFFLYFFSLL